VSRRILDDYAGTGGIPQRALAGTIRAAVPGPPTYVGGYELHWLRHDPLPSRFPLPADDFIIHHGDDFTLVPENQKTYRRLFGMIFFGGSDPMLASVLQQFATRKILKNRQNSKVNSFFDS
jgi:hypothetical protein